MAYTFPSELISALNKSIYTDNKTSNWFKKVNEVSIKAGYIVEPAACSKAAYDWAKEQSYNPNSTFWKEWNNVKSKSETELCFAQLAHYFTTYGVALVMGEEFVDGNGFVLNGAPPLIQFENYKVIKAAEPEEIFKDLYGMLTSGIALNSKTVSAAVEFIEHFKFLDTVNVDVVANKEAQALLSARKGILPKDEFAMLRILVYTVTGSTMIVKDAKTIETIRYACTRPEVETMLQSLDEKQMKSLSHIFLRYKPIFLAMKKAAPKTINRIRRLAVKNHRPLQASFWESCLFTTGKDPNDMLKYAFENAESINNFKKIQLIEAITYRETSDVNSQFYHIRNGKTFIRENYQPQVNEKYLNELRVILIDSLCKSLVKKHSNEDGVLPTIKLPESLMMVCPTSEKNFVGNIPSGSYINLEKDGKVSNSILGIYWRGEWGTQDFDLHYSSFNGASYGWSSYHKDNENKILFSGDMTRANPEASECFYIDGAAPDGILSIYRFWGETPVTKFKFYAATEEVTDLTRGYMVDPSNIKFEAMIDAESEGEKQLACVFNNKVYFTNESLSGGQAPSRNLTELYKKALPKKLESHIVFSDLLKVVGFPVEYSKDCEWSKADLIDFFTE